jgi:tetratricopeptide (TPR) repeat protein
MNDIFKNLMKILCIIVLLFTMIGGCIPQKGAKRHFDNAYKFLKLGMEEEAFIELKNGYRILEQEEALIMAQYKPLVNGAEYLLKRDDDKALEEFKKVRDTGKYEQMIADNLGVYTDVKTALGIFFIWKEKYDNAAALLEIGGDKNLSPIEKNLIDGIKSYKAGKYGDFIAKFKEVEILLKPEKDDQSKDVYEAMTAAIKVAMARGYEKKGDLAAALGEYEEVVKANPDLLNYVDGDIKTLKIKQSIKEKPKDVSLFSRLGWEYLEHNKLNDALDAYKKAIELDATLSSAYNNIGLIYLIKKNNSVAVNYFYKSIELNNDPQAKSNSYYNLGRIYLEQEKYNQAFLSFADAIKINSSNTQMMKECNIALQMRDTLAQPEGKDKHLKLGWLYLTLGNTEESIKAFKSALAKEKGDAYASFGMGEANYGSGRYSEAIKYYDACTKEAWGDKALLKIGEAYAKMDKYQNAEVSFKSALKLNPANTEALNMLAYLYFENGYEKESLDAWNLLLTKTNDGKLKQKIKNILNILS